MMTFLLLMAMVVLAVVAYVHGPGRALHIVGLLVLLFLLWHWEVLLLLGFCMFLRFFKAGRC